MMICIVYYIERMTDGRLARVIIDDPFLAPMFSEDDPWAPLQAAMPRAFELVREDNVMFDAPANRTWDLTFYGNEDDACVRWLEGHYEGDLDDDHGCAVNIAADDIEGVATVTWTPRDGGAARAMDIRLNPGDYEKLCAGADPVAEGWEDGGQHLVGWTNAQEVER